MVVIYVIMMKGINTMNHDRRVSPPMHSWLSKMVKIIMTTIFKNALFCCPLNKSIII